VPGVGIVGGVAPYVRPQGTSGPGGNTLVDTDPTDDNRFWMLGAGAAGIPTFDGNSLLCKGSNQEVYDWATWVAIASFRKPLGGLLSTECPPVPTDSPLHRERN
jgi:hypothetical protein